jgi:phage terminase large subunit-like protein
MHGNVYVLRDLSSSATPDGWARKPVDAYLQYKADRLVAEVNNCGDLVEKVIRTIDPREACKKVHASRG